jgi:hypothetical protein
MLFPTLRLWVSKKFELSDASIALQHQHDEHDRLTAQVARWQDPFFIQQQARDRINMVMPGETAYWVTGENIGTKEAPEDKQAVTELNWVTRLLGTAGE